MYEIPRLELKTILIIANRGEFRGSSFDKFSNKSINGEQTKKYIREKNWENLLKYIEQEAEAFFEIYQKLLKNIPKILPKKLG